MNRKDLAVIVEQQKEQIAHYEKKLRDVVRAYKALLKERDALQTGLNALKAASSARSTEGLPSSSAESCITAASGRENAVVSPGDTGNARLDEASEEEADAASTVASEDGKISEEDVKLQLSTALSEMSTEKDRLQKSFLLERKSFSIEKEKLQEEVKKLEESRAAAVANAKDLRQRVQALQAERTADADDAAVKLRECQRVVAEEREAREKAELQLQQLQHRLQQRSLQHKQHLQHEPHTQQHYKQITELKNVICQLEARLTSSDKEEQARLAEMEQLQQLHAAAATALHQECQRAQEAEAELSRVLAANREREAALEARLAEAVNCMASTAGADTSASATLRHYKNRVQELTEQNAELSRQLETLSMSNQRDGTSRGGEAGTPVGGGDQEATYLLKQIKKLLLQLQLMNIKPAQRKDLEDALGGSDVLHEACKQEQASLRQQLQGLRRPPDSGTSVWHRDSHDWQHVSDSGAPDAARGWKDTNPEASKTEEDAGAQVRVLRQELRNVATAAQVTETAHLQQIEQLKQECRNLRTECEQRITSAQQSHRAVVCSLEQQLTSQRLHSLATLQERDVELHRLQQQLHSLAMDTSHSKVPKALVNTTTTAARSGPLLHHIEELQRREQEIVSLQQEKRQLQQAVREVQQSALEKRLQHEDRLAHLEMQLERFNRNQSRESQNLEYLKNVLLHFLTNGEGVGSSGGGAYGRQAMVKAVAAVLKLTPKEEERLRKHSSGREGWWWWGSTASALEAAKK
ncbi:GRIP domain [Trinorchestia longiramus]|nr:GRIP domain [Trinorchestia longiramus]